MKQTLVDLRPTIQAIREIAEVRHILAGSATAVSVGDNVMAELDKSLSTLTVRLNHQVNRLETLEEES